MQITFPSEFEVKEGVSLICAVKNRNESLSQALNTWIKRSEIDEIIIVDWDSDEPVKDIVEEYQDGRIKIAHVPNQPKWILSWAYNLAARLTSHSKILKLDADIFLSDDFFEKCELESGSFFAGNWRIAQSEDDEHLSGQMFLHRSNFFSVNGFDERITTYGYDEEDLYDRLEMGIDKIAMERKKWKQLKWTSRIRLRKMLPPVLREKYAKLFINYQQSKLLNRKTKSKMKRKDIPLECLSHIAHSNDMRVAHQDVNPDKLIDEAKLNRCKVTIPWSDAFTMKEFEISAQDGNVMLCKMKDYSTLNVAV